MVQRVANEGECRQMRVMHIRRGVKRTASAFSVGGDMIRVVQSY